MSPNRKQKIAADNTKPLSRSALRRQRERQLRYQTILQAAESLFAREGYHQTSMERIADAAEVSVGALYLYVKNKEDLLVSLMSDIGFRLRVVLGEAFNQFGPTLEGLQRAGYAFFEEFCLHYPEKIAIIFRESVGQSPAVEKKRKQIFDKLTRDVADALRKISDNLGQEFKSRATPEVISVSIMGIYDRVACQYLFGNSPEQDLEAVGREAVGFIVGGIRNLLGEDGPCT